MAVQLDGVGKRGAALPLSPLAGPVWVLARMDPCRENAAKAPHGSCMKSDGSSCQSSATGLFWRIFCPTGTAWHSGPTDSLEGGSQNQSLRKRQ